MPVVRMEDATKKFGDVLAVDKVTLEISAGEIFGLLGPNGAGKSTAINLIIGLLRLDGGRISVLDNDVTSNLMAVKRNIGVVPQELAIYEDLTSLENVMFFASLYGLSGRALRKAAEEALEFSGLKDQSKGIPKKFSGGMKRRLNIACAIAHKPKLIIMDEPTVGIDPQTRSHILQSVGILNSQGCTVIYTTHYMEEAEEICSRVAIMDHGKIIAEGTDSELKALIVEKNMLWVTLSDTPARVDASRLSVIHGVTNVEIDENIVKVTSERETNVLQPVISYFTSAAIQIKNVESKLPDLETVFLSLTGRSLRN